jgi:hypothetical protein
MDEFAEYRETIESHLTVQRHMWLGLRSLLADRPGWHFVSNDYAEPGWCFGHRGECRLFVSVRGDSFYLWDADEEMPHVAPALTLERLLAELEPTHSGSS